MVKLFWISFTCFVFSCPVYGQASEMKEAKALIQKFVEQENIPGLAATVYHRGEIVWSEGFGYANVKNKVKVDPAMTKFRIGSISKTFTAAALGRVMETKPVDLDAPIQKYVPSFPEKKYPISMRQLGGHTAGIRHYKGGEFMSTKYYPTVDEGLDIFKADPLLFEPSTKYQYSSYGWNLLSAAIESIAEKPFLEYISEEVFTELKMDNTIPEYTDREISNKTTYYVNASNGFEEAPFVDNSYKWAGGGFLSTTHDLILFGKAHMTTAYLNQKTLKTLMAPQELNDGKSTNYGIGWRSYEDEKGVTWIGHSGGSVGGTSIFIMNKELDMIVAITGNKSSIRYNKLHFDLAHIFLD